MSLSRTRWAWVSLSYATFGVAVRGTKVVDAAPIARWMIGKDTRTVAQWLDRKNATVVWLDEWRKGMEHQDTLNEALEAADPAMRRLMEQPLTAVPSAELELAAWRIELVSAAIRAELATRGPNPVDLG